MAGAPSVNGLAGPMNHSRQKGALRPVAPEDGAFLRALFFAVKAEEFAQLALPPAMLEMMLDQQFHAQQLGHETMFPKAERYVVERAGEPAGRMMIARLGEDRLHLIDIALLTAARGQGLGANVLTVLIATARAEGFRRMTLSVAALNVGATRLYCRLGFRFTGNGPGAAATREMELIL